MTAALEIRGGVRKLEIEPHSGSLNCGFGCNGKLEDIGKGRFPANTILTYDQITWDEVCGNMPYTKNSKRNSSYNKDTEYTNTYTPPKAIYTDDNTYGDSGSACRYFYCAKASKKDRDEGLENFEIKGAKELLNREENSDGASWNGKYSSGNAYAGSGAPKRNTHPTVKPTELMQYLVRLVTPKGGTVLDPFMRKWKHRESSCL